MGVQTKSKKHKSENHEKDENLMTTKALRLSLSPPRCAPVGTAHRVFLDGQAPLHHQPYAEHHEEGEKNAAHSDYNLHSGIRENILHLVYQPAPRSLGIRHPHISSGPERADQITRFLGSLLPVSWQNRIRDTGRFRSICDTIVEMSIPVGAVSNPSAVKCFLRLTRARRRICYGEHEAQFMDVFTPENIDREDWTGMMFFVHGGAWGSGRPLYYRLVAQTFLELGMAVAIVGYRVYPAGNTSSQVFDLTAAHSLLSREFPDLCGPDRRRRPVGYCACGHSSGAHIALMMLVNQVKRSLLTNELEDTSLARSSCAASFDVFLGLSGPYDISNHFDYEAARGVEELSPMKACNGYTRKQFRNNSPTHQLRDFLAGFLESRSKDSAIAKYFPEVLLVHGIEDDTVPFTATAETAKILRSVGVQTCDEYYAPLTGHQDVVMHLMLGGRVKDYIREWLQQRNLPTAINLRSSL